MVRNRVTLCLLVVAMLAGSVASAKGFTVNKGVAVSNGFTVNK